MAHSCSVEERKEWGVGVGPNRHVCVGHHRTLTCTTQPATVKGTATKASAGLTPPPCDIRAPAMATSPVVDDWVV